MMTTLYLATSDGLIVATRRNGRWRAARPLGAGPDSVGSLALFSCVAADPSRPERVFCGGADPSVWRSDDAGADWRRVFEGLPHERITSLAVSGTERADGYGVAYVGTEPSAVFRSEDDGETWRQCAELTDLPSAGEWRFPPRPQTHHARWIEPDPHAPGKLYVAIEAGALVSTSDGGQTWRDRVPHGPYDTHQLATHTDATGWLWSAAGDGFYESNDAGESWRRVEDGLRFNYCFSVAVDSGDPAIVVLSAAPDPTRAYNSDRDQAESAVYRRTGDGPWQEVRAGLPESKGTRVPALAANPAEPGVFYCAADAAVYRSSDGGAAWRRLDVEWPGENRGSRVHALVVAEIG